MILALMAYCMLTAGLVGFTALGAEAALRTAGRPGRVPWIVGLVAVLVAPLGMLLFPEDGMLAVPVGIRDAGSMNIAPTDRMVGFASLDPLAAGVWLVASAAFVIVLAGAGIKLRRWRRSWRRTRVQGTTVLVSSHVGPAVIGLWDGEIVVPEWALQAGNDAVGLLLEHERQHLAARDHRIVCVALGALVLMPWNLPLWWIVARLRLATEIDCDARVLAWTRSDVESYGSLLIAVGQRLSNTPAVGIAFSRPISNLEYRIRALTAGRNRHQLGRGLGWVGLSAVSFSLLCLAPHPVIQVCRSAVDSEPAQRVVLQVTPHRPVVVRVLDGR